MDTRVHSIDTVTGAFTGEGMLDAIREQMEAADQAKGYLSLVIVDMDRFMRVNTEFGEAVGDAVLRGLVRQLSEPAPPCAAPGMVYRHGGDEMIVLLPGAEKEQAFLWAEACRRAFNGNQQFTVDGSSVTVPLSVSAAVSCYPEDGARAQDLLRKVSDALYRAKDGGGNRVCLSREERMVTKTSHYTQGQLDRLSYLAKKEGVGEAVLLRESLDDLLRKYGV